MKPPQLHTIVIPSAAYRFVLGQFARELWDYETWKTVKAVPLQPFESVRMDDLYWQTDAIKRLVHERLPQQRRELLQRWPVADQRRFGEDLQILFSRAGDHPNVRVSAVSFESWLLEEPDFECPEEVPETDAERVLKLASIRGYDDWLAEGGDADVGRLLGLWARAVFEAESSD